MWPRPPNGWGGHGQPPSLQQGQPPAPPYINLDSSDYYIQNLSSAFLLNTHLLQQQQNPNFPFQPGNLNFPFWNPNFHPPQQPLLPQTQPQQQAALPPPPQKQQPKAQTQPQTQEPPARPTQQRQPPQKQEQCTAASSLSLKKLKTQQNQGEAVSHIRKGKHNAAAKEKLEPIEAAVEKARLDLLAAKENVSAWKVSQAVLVALQVDSWDLLGVKMQEVHSLHRLMVMESKINAFIHCFVGVRRITSVYDLDVAICENEGIGHFEELELGPLLRHPLVSHYFSVDADVTKVFKITSEDVILALSQFMDTCKKAVAVDEFLHFLATKLSVKGKDMLGVRMQSIGMHISFIQEARRSESVAMGKCRKELARNYDNKDKIPKGSEDERLKKCQEAAAKKSNGKGSKRPLFSLQNKGLERRFLAVRQRMESFSSENTEFYGKHIRFVSSSSEDEESDDSTLEDKVPPHNAGHHSPISLQNVSSSDRVSSCPYPSATEEMSRLGLIGEVGGPSSSASCSTRKNERSGPLKKKRKHDDASCNISQPSKLVKGDERTHKRPPNWKDGSATSDVDLTLSVDSISAFVSSWKEACKESSLSEILERMLELYNPSDARAATRHKAKVMLMFSSHPFIGLLNVALKSIKLGMWDSIYDTIQAVNQFESTNTLSPKCILERMLELYNPSDARAATRHKAKVMLMFSSHPFIGLLNVALKSIKLGMWDSIYDTIQAVNQFESTNTLSPKCSEYETIGVESGEKNAVVVMEHNVQQRQSVTVEEVIGKVVGYYELDIKGQSSGNSHLEKKFMSLMRVCRCESWLADQFGVKEFKSLGFGEFFAFLEAHTSRLPSDLQKLFAIDISEKAPVEVYMGLHQLNALVSQALNGSLENEIITKQKIYGLLKRQFPVLSFKITENGSMEEFLQTIRNYKSNVMPKSVVFSAALLDAHHIENSSPLNEDTILGRNHTGQQINLKSDTSKDAIELLLKAPMLSDLNLWSHWDIKFAPYLGPLVEWLSGEVIAGELLCLVTKDGKVMRIDQSATADSFLKAALQRSPFHTAGKLLSLFSLAGGGGQVPLFLLKEYSRRAFEAIMKDHSESVEVEVTNKYCSSESTTQGLLGNNVAQQKMFKMKQEALVASRFVLDCLCWLPSEFHGFAADVLLSGMKLVAKEAPLAMLCQCNQEERLMLHEIGLSIGILEWIDDHRAFCSTSMTDLVTSSGPSYMEAAKSDLSCAVGTMTRTITEHEYNKECTQLSRTNDVASSGVSGHDCIEQLSDADKLSDAVMVIESIRKEEFGLDHDLSNTESFMLKKQHARLGRALHCLSQELYSQDSHFLLELVQNADDNIYPENIEPTLAFILQESGVTILNNERGFSAENIRALCDVGNSTKKGSGGGYIGQKGIGFKSVFRITDAPEIHSNGFHIKFDISEGQIGFVLPTALPPCNISLFSGLLDNKSWNTCIDQADNKCWNTCIVLPFRSKLSEETAMTMFSDLHPSLLLFLQRLQCIMFRNVLNDSLIVMRKEIRDDGIVKVSCGNEKMSWLVASQKLQDSLIVSSPRVQTTEIAIAFTLEESDNGVYSPHLEQQPVFAFLPLRTYGLKFILQGDFILPSSREEVDRNNPWNEWLLTKVPGLFVSAERSFCALSCFKDNPGKAVAAYMSFVPIVGEVQGFFSGLPKAIIQELRRTNCLLLEGDNSKMVPPCNVLRGWDEAARCILREDLLQEHFGLGFLDKNIVLSDSLATALGIREYGPEILVKFMTHLCFTENALTSMGLVWLSLWLNTIYTMLSHYSGQINLLDNLRHIPFIPLSDGTYSSVDVGTIWLHSDALTTEFGAAQGLEAFPKLYAKLRTVNPALLSASASDGASADNVTRMLQRLGVQQLSAHDIMKVHVLQSICDGRVTDSNKDLMIDYLCFVMTHLQSGCSSCCVERKHILSELQNKAYILTNHGFKTPGQTSIHFSKEYGNPVNVNKLINAGGMRWHEVESDYLKHPASKSLANGLKKWREFFQEIGVTDFVQVFQIEKSIAELSPTVFKNMMWDADLILPGSTVKDWESPELVDLLSLLSMNGDGECCKYLLEVFDMLWDDSFSNKTTCHINFKSSGDGKAFKSSFITKIHDVRWVTSNLDSKLHYPRDLFYDCDEVRSVLGASAPYALPKVKSRNLVCDIGFKTEVTVDDALGILSLWRKSEIPFKSSIANMHKLYTFIWDEMVTSKNKILDAFHAAPFIFVPYEYGYRHGDVVPGEFLSVEEVCWHDPTGSMDLMKGFHPECSSSSIVELPLRKTLANVYRGLHDFFVRECGVCEIPSCRSYLHILQQLSATALPSQVANSVFQVFIKWAEALKCGFLSSEDISYLKECLAKLEYKVLPSALDKWVSLHPSFGLVCWCDDKELKRRFKALKNIDFLNFGDLKDNEQEMLQTRVSPLLQNLGIPALSQVVTREAIYYGPADCSLKASLLNWALPYAQRYIYTKHPDKYLPFKQSEFNCLEKLQIVVVEKLFYKNVIKQLGTSSNHRDECSCLLQGDTLYTTVESDSHDLFLELSRLFFEGIPELPFANFLHVITTKAENGSTEEQIEFFIINTQKVPKLPDEESVWQLPSMPPFTENDGSIQPGTAPMATKDQKTSKPKFRAGIGSNWPPTDWKTAPGFNYGRKTQSGVLYPSTSDEINKDNSTEVVPASDSEVPIMLDTDWSMEVEADKVALNWLDSENVGERFASTSNQTPITDHNPSNQIPVAVPDMFNQTLAVNRNTFNLTPTAKPRTSNQTPITDHNPSNQIPVAVPDMFNQTLAVNLNTFNLTPTAKPRTSNQTPNSNVEIDDIDLCLVSDSPELDALLSFFRGYQHNPGTPNALLALLTGRVGERVAYQYLAGKFGAEVVKWVNKDNETGLPYDIVIEGDASTREYIEVKATISPKKDWFTISTREWQFAVEKGDSFSVVHVLLGNALARVTTLKNLVKQCQSGNLKLVLKMLT